MATPLIRPLRPVSGTIYVFNSAANDISKTFSDDNFRFNFSKFVALELPEVNVPTNNSNNLHWQAIGNRSGGWNTTVIDDMVSGSISSNKDIANNFQNYVLNWENLVLNQQNSDGNLYDGTSYQSVTERMFWKWLIDLGAIRFDNATSADATINNLFVEEEEDENGSTKDQYTPIVKYMGDITLINNVNRGGEAYSQVYLHIPDNHGNTPTVLFKNLSDSNYAPTLKWFGTNGDDIEGRSSHVDANMSVKAYFYDNINDFYTTGNTFGATSNTTIQISNDDNPTLTNPYDVLVSDMDGVVLDWEPSDYTKIVNDPAVQSISEFNGTAEADDFDFNTVLIYYDVYDASTPSNTKRNLYGVLFIDDFEESINSGSDLKSFPKYKPNAVTKLNGNAYSLKTNIKFDTSADNVGVERSINEYSTFSMDLFSDAMISLQDSLESFSTQELKINDLNEKVDNLEKFYFSQATIDELRKEVANLEQIVQNATTALESPSTLIELIRNNSDRINSLAAGDLSTTLSYDLSPFVQGDGVKVDKSVPNKVRLSNIVQEYNHIGITYTTSGALSYAVGNGVTDSNDIGFPDKNNIISFGTFTNYFKNTTASSVVTNDLVINIDDKNHKFKTGQTYKIYFENDLDLSNTKSIFIYTDSTNRLNQGSFKWLVGKVFSTDLISKKPIIEIICTDEVTYEFDINILR